MTIVLSILAVLSAFYFVVLQVLSPSTFWGTLCSFSMIWIILSAFFVFLIFVRKKHLWSKLSSGLRNFIASAFGLISIIFVINLLFIIHPSLVSEKQDSKYMILLGGGITKNKTLSENVQKRCQKAADYLKEHPETLVVVSGGQTNFAPCPEADVLKEYLMSIGIKEKRILVENQAMDTIQNLKYSAELLSESENKSIQEIIDSPVVIVSSFNHIARAELLAKRMGYKEVYGIGSRTPWWYIVHSYFREILAYMKLILRIVITRQPSSIAAQFTNNLSS